MISSGFFVSVLIICFIGIILSMFAHKSDVICGCVIGIIAANMLDVVIGCIAVIDGKIQVWETDTLRASMTTKCFQVGHEQKCGVFDISTDEYRYVSDGNKLTVYAK